MNWPNIIICCLLLGMLVWAFYNGFDDYNDFS
jgi:hypothetical protein